MRIQSLTSSLGLVLLVAALDAPEASGEPRATPEPTPDCQASLSPNAVPRQVMPVEVRLKTPLTLGAVNAVEFEEKSGLQAVDPPVREAGSLTFKVDTSQAQTGFWNLVLKGVNGDCRAVLEIL